MLIQYPFSGLVAGCDEAGRGCLAGPVFAAAVVLPKNFEHELLNDSKKLTDDQRRSLRSIIEEESIAWAVASLSPREIEEHNILWSSFMAMHRAIDQLSTSIDLLLIDGNRFIPYSNIKHKCIVKGDGIYLSIAAASVLAKTYRDDFMISLAQRHPEYGWEQNKGYPTKQHRVALKAHGPTDHHRRTFRLLPDQPTLFDSPL